MKLVSLKDYAKLKHISYEAVRKSVLRYEEELKGHLIKQGKTRLLDDEGVKILDEHRKENPISVSYITEREHLEILEEENKALKDRLIEIQTKLIEARAERDQLIEDKTRAQTQLEDKAQQIEELKAERDQARQEANSFERSIFGLYKKKRG